MLYIVIILFVVFSGVLAVVAFENFTTQVQITIFAWQSPYFPVGLLLLLAFVLGAVLLYIVAAASAWSDWNQLRNLRRYISELEAKLRQSSVPVAQATPEVPVAHPVQSVPDSLETPNGQSMSSMQNVQNIPNNQNAPNSPIPQSGPIVPMPGMPTKPDISDMPTQH